MFFVFVKGIVFIIYIYMWNFFLVIVLFWFKFFKFCVVYFFKFWLVVKVEVILRFFVYFVFELG